MARKPKEREPSWREVAIGEAMRHVGYRAQPNRQSAFQLRPYLNRAWNGTFVDRVLHDTFGDFAEVRFISTVTALSYYVKRNRLYQKPAGAGDIVFFPFASDPARWDEQPHVGIVVDILDNGTFRTVEGETAPGQPQGSQLVDGVFERTRHVSDTIGFVRPKVRTVPMDYGNPTALKMSHFESNPKTTARAIENVQFALNRVRKRLVFNRGKKDAEFRSTFGLYARETGSPENRGELTYTALSILSDESGSFVLE